MVYKGKRHNGRETNDNTNSHSSRYFTSSLSVLIFFSKVAMLQIVYAVVVKLPTVYLSLLQLHPVIKQLYGGVGSELAFPPNLFPSVAPPIPWTDASNAGFFLPAGECEVFSCKLINTPRLATVIMDCRNGEHQIKFNVVFL